MTNKKSVSIPQVAIILFIVVCLMAMLPFSQKLLVSLAEHAIGRNLRSITKWSVVITHTAAFFATLAVSLYFLAFVEHGKRIGADIIATLKHAFYDKKRACMLMSLAAILIFISYFSIILANYDYTDDIRRSFTGHKAWIGWTRIISESFAVFLHTNFYINDIWPLTHIVSIAILALTAYFLSYIATNNTTPSPIHIITASFFSITPYFAINMSFKFDSPYMSLAILFAVLPFLWVHHTKTFIFTSFISLQLVCTSYQAANSVYIVLAVFSALQLWMSGKTWKDIFCFAGIAILSYAVALLFFKLLIAIPREWNGTRPDIISIAAIPQNILNYSKTVISSYGNTWIRLFTLLALFLFPFAAVSQSKQNKVSTAFLSLLSLVLMFTLGIGAYLVLQNMLLAARTYMGFDMLISIILLLDVSAFGKNKTLKQLSYATAICLFWGFCVSTNSIGTFYNKYKEYTRFRFDTLLQDLNEIVSPDAYNTLYINNSIEFPESVRMVLKNYPVERFTMTTNTMQYLIKGYDMDFEILNEDFIDEIEDKELVKKLTDLPLIKDTYYHTIYGKDNQYFVEFKNPKPQEQ